jgi:hypothetical protein
LLFLSSLLNVNILLSTLISGALKAAKVLFLRLLFIKTGLVRVQPRGRGPRC